MPVYKAYFKIFQKRIYTLLIYIVVFLGILYLFSQNASSGNKGYENTKVRTAFINKDTESKLVAELYAFLKDYCEFVEVPENTIEDALFIRKIDYVIAIEEGSEERFMAGDTNLVNIRTRPDSYNAISVNSAINNFLNTARVLHNHINKLTVDELVKNLKLNMAEEAEVTVFNSNAIQVNENDYYERYFNYLSYIMVACFILVIGTIMNTFQTCSIKKRNLVAPISLKKMNLQLILCNFIFSTAFLILFIGIGFALSKEHVLNANVVLYACNAFIFSLIALAIGYLFGIILKSTKSMTVVSTVISLLFAFLGGIFVPLDMLGDTVLKVARIIPSYWFTLGNAYISKLTHYNLDNMAELIKYFIIEIGMATVIFVVTILYGKKRDRQET